MNLLEQKLSRIDLNLLVSLSVLLKERNVSKAAQTLYLSQPAMSRTLQRLRDLFDDPLFYRTSTGISPTAKAARLEQMLPELLESLGHILENNEFDASTSEANFAVSIPSIIGQSMVFPLFIDLLNEAPNISWSEYPAKSNPFDLLESGTLDFAVHIAKDVHPTFISTPIGKVNPVIFARKDHPLLAIENRQLKHCMNYNFLGLIVENDSHVKFSNPVDSLLLKNGVKPKSIFRSSQMQILTDILKTTDALLIGMNSLMEAKDFSDLFAPIYSFAQNNENSIEFVLLEHQRTENSQAHRWFKEKLLNHLGNLS